MKHYFLFLSFLFLTVASVFSKNYPVNAHYKVFPPFSSYIPDYLDAGNSKMQLSLDIADTKVTNIQVKSKGWVKAGMLALGMMVQTSASAEFVPVIENVEKDTIAEVYNFTVEQSHTYYVGKSNLLVHNAL